VASKGMEFVDLEDILKRFSELSFKQGGVVEEFSVINNPPKHGNGVLSGLMMWLDSNDSFMISATLNANGEGVRYSCLSERYKLKYSSFVIDERGDIFIMQDDHGYKTYFTVFSGMLQSKTAKDVFEGR